MAQRVDSRKHHFSLVSKRRLFEPQCSAVYLIYFASRAVKRKGKQCVQTMLASHPSVNQSTNPLKVPMLTSTECMGMLCCLQSRGCI